MRSAAAPVATVAQTQQNSQQQWAAFWKSGGAVDFNSSPRKRFALDPGGLEKGFVAKYSPVGALVVVPFGRTRKVGMVVAHPAETPVAKTPAPAPSAPKAAPAAAAPAPVPPPTPTPAIRCARWEPICAWASAPWPTPGGVQTRR